MTIMLQAKRAMASLLTHRMVGGVIAAATGNRIPAFGLRIDSSNPLVSPEIKAKLFFGIYESAERRFVARYLPGDADVVELGASLGVLTSIIRRRVSQPRRIVAVEANPLLAPILRRTLEVNGCDANVFVEVAAIHYGPEEEVSFSVGRHSTDGRVRHAADGGVSVIRTPTVTLSRILRRHQVRDFSLIADIEGAEWGVIEHDLEAAAAAKIIIIELHTSSVGEDAEILLGRLLATGRFDLVDRYGNSCVLRPRSTKGRAA
ncbi:FkbM family methyltransferase [Emcibacter sp. SYSU 3D8]|uniref:FkbM family methyltransferase n=1 Tax=Emcibacter sp. SYSU 3D8 TaxID=3133969 RepID=UPI0031FE790A